MMDRKRVILTVQIIDEDTGVVLGQAHHGVDLPTHLLRGSGMFVGGMQDNFSAMVSDLGTQAYMAAFPRQPK